jgi:hypothetical protein
MTLTMASDKEERDLSMESSKSLYYFARPAYCLVEPTCSAKLCPSTSTIDADFI